ncbi:hypothetical protein N7470_005255 [Penicillium chermesinum]|nr:hypothetical protein N7470_005255 [Penicillium chermesinum]
MATPTRSLRHLSSVRTKTASPVTSLTTHLIYRTYATTDGSSATSTPGITRRRKTSFQDKLNAGPSFSDFVSGGGDNGPSSPTKLMP